ncbi:uncharacterized protein NECHADRAFT_75662 [Fusarium vanettenii 77-13-4]|uniref:Uncharacterized protein n=1 Tax=Fusarium vanettenii (strain ATCC MYA-4622 / CBS 123669 / FGSC 9596 / NRRL 45880 / 77-13-4) TaxID=660122 RepID=C7YJF7_FUSV7|nr:uncharacterized protein NECHADRAFT_75662 [Fusarium vanettenii 77-13-4]EEU48267.1 hypothetical protein NECHADRAFT_75662 [Fusarium vanettenii 77-13-4]
MCHEVITIALCAPTKAPSLSFTCGKLHMIAQQRHVCDRARGSCVCFFGTCGTVEKNASTSGIDLSAIEKIRCAECTTREDNVGDRRDAKQIIESPLLQRIPIEPTDDFVNKKHSAMLHELWGGARTCPFHLQPDRPRQPSASTVNVQTKRFDERPVTPQTNDESVTKSHSMSRDSVDKGWTSQAATNNSSKSKLSRKSSASPTGIASVDSAVGLGSSRWAPKNLEEAAARSVKNQSPPTQKRPSPLQKQSSPPSQKRIVPAAAPVFVADPGNASKVRHATKKMANMKAFLSGTPMF